MTGLQFKPLFSRLHMWMVGIRFKPTINCLDLSGLNTFLVDWTLNMNIQSNKASSCSVLTQHNGYTRPYDTRQTVFSLLNPYFPPPSSWKRNPWIRRTSEKQTHWKFPRSERRGVAASQGSRAPRLFNRAIMWRCQMKLVENVVREHGENAEEGADNFLLSDTKSRAEGTKDWIGNWDYQATPSVRQK